MRRDEIAHLDQRHRVVTDAVYSVDCVCGYHLASADEFGDVARSDVEAAFAEHLQDVAKICVECDAEDVLFCKCVTPRAVAQRGFLLADEIDGPAWHYDDSATR